MASSAADALGRFLTLADVAEVLKVEVADVLAMAQSGELPAIRVGANGQWRVERDVLESFIEAKYEEARRLNLWNQSDFANIPELSGGRIIRPTSDET